MRSFTIRQPSGGNVGLVRRRRVRRRQKLTVTQHVGPMSSKLRRKVYPWGGYPQRRRTTQHRRRKQQQYSLNHTRAHAHGAADPQSSHEPQQIIVDDSCFVVSLFGCCFVGAAPLASCTEFPLLRGIVSRRKKWMAGGRAMRARQNPRRSK
ncbi:hypothetical protein ISCGN_021769 [Ixodes scapularis]